MASYASQTATMRAASGIAFAGQPVGITGAVRTFVMGPDDRRDRNQDRHRPEELVTDDGVALHFGVFVVGEASGLGQDRVLDAELADIVQERTQDQVPELPGRKVQCLAGATREFSRRVRRGRA